MQKFENALAPLTFASLTSLGHTLTRRETLWAECDRQLAHVLCSAFYSMVVKQAAGLDPGLVCVSVYVDGEGKGLSIQAWTGGVGSRKLGVPCENVAVAGLGTICAPSRAPSAFPATQTHMDTQRCSLSLPPSHGCAVTHTRSLTGSGEKHTWDRTARDERKDDEFVDCAVNRMMVSWWQCWCKCDDFRGIISQQRGQLCSDIHTNSYL